jgi:hypothetical protein
MLHLASKPNQLMIFRVKLLFTVRYETHKLYGYRADVHYVMLSWYPQFHVALHASHAALPLD